jgi:hyperosmotically inducible periplasmic protein
MQKRHSMTVLAAALAGIALFGAGCSDQNSPQTVGQKIDRATDKMATVTDNAANKVAAATENAANKTSAVIDDATITTKVKSAVLAEPGLKTLQIDVDTKNGVVTLAGTVDSPALKERATQVTQGVSGVSSVNNNLTVKAG